MSSKSVSRFEELDAGRALGDLSLEEVEEWEALAQEGAMDQTIDFDLLATELELNHTEDCALSSSLATRLEDTIPAFSALLNQTNQPLDKSYQSFPGSAGPLRHASLFSLICPLVMIHRIFQLNWHRRRQNFQIRKRPLLIWNPPNKSWLNLMKN